MARLLAICVALIFALSIALTSSAGAKVGATCGGIAGVKCGPHEFCEKPPGTCTIIDMQGTCVRVPVVCPFAKKEAAIVAPVCGCNMKTYGNDCLRQHAKVSKAHDGKCY
jgi:Kazal-type serine protease inhibitor domain